MQQDRSFRCGSTVSAWEVCSFPSLGLTHLIKDLTYSTTETLPGENDLKIVKLVTNHHPCRSEKIDWGVAQLDTVMDRSEINSSHFLSLTNFGDHGMHHLFPTIDHAVLQFLNPVFEKTCREFGVSLRLTSQLDMIRAQFLQLANSTPNPAPFRAGGPRDAKGRSVA